MPVNEDGIPSVAPVVRVRGFGEESQDLGIGRNP